MFKRQAEVYKKAINIMIDFETLSLDENAVILQFGLASSIYDPILDMAVENNSMLLNLSANSQLLNRNISIETLNWWLKQDKEVAKEVFSDENISLREALEKINSHILNEKTVNQNIFLWSNGSLSDTIWLKKIYEEFGMDFPFSHRQEKCFKTEMSFVSDFIMHKIHENKSQHNALEDAKWQLNALLLFLNDYDLMIQEMDSFYDKTK